MAIRGFWSERPRRGAEDARLLATERLHALRQESHAELLARADRSAEVERVTTPSGGTLCRRSAVTRFRRGGEEELQVRVRVDTGTFLGRLNPLAERVVLVSADGQMLGDYTMASEGNDPRRYRFR